MRIAGLAYSCGDITFSSLDEGAAGRYAYQDVHLKEIVAAQGVCNGSNGPAGNDDCCPHRVLVRKVIRSSAAPPETPLANVAPYLTRPNGLSVDNMVAEPHLLEVKLAATSLLYLRVQLAATGVC